VASLVNILTRDVIPRRVLGIRSRGRRRKGGGQLIGATPGRSMEDLRYLAKQHGSSGASSLSTQMDVPAGCRFCACRDLIWIRERPRAGKRSQSHGSREDATASSRGCGLFGKKKQGRPTSIWGGGKQFAYKEGRPWDDPAQGGAW